MLSHKLDPGPASGPPAAHAASHRGGGDDVIEDKIVIGLANVSGTNSFVMSGYGLLLAGLATDTSSAHDSSSDGIGFKQTSAASAGSDACYNFPTTAAFDTVVLPKIRIKAKIDTAANVRYFYGLSSDNAAGTVDADDPAAYQCGFQFSSGRDTNWQLALDNNGTQVLTDTLIAAAAGVYWFEIEITATGQCKFTLEDGDYTELYSNTILLNVPSAGNLLYLVVGGETTTTAAINPITYKIEVRVP